MTERIELELQRIRKLLAIFIMNQTPNGIDSVSSLWDFVDDMTKSGQE